jgi:glutaminyl-tRNA synthetase
MPTISGYRRRGYPAVAIRDFTKRIGISKSNSTIEVQSLEACVREHLNQIALRRMAVLKPLKVVIENYPDGQTEEFEAKNNPNDENSGTRKIQFTREFFIEQDDFMEDPPKKFFRLAPGREVRLRYAYFITCTAVLKNEEKEIVEIRCTYDPETKGGNAPDGRKVKGTIHWVAAPYAIEAEIRQYEHLFTKEIPGENGEFLDDINSESLKILSNCKLESALKNTPIGETIQFERLGYYSADKDTSSSHLIFNQTIELRDTWGKNKRSENA